MLQYRQLVKRVFNVSAIPTNHTLQTTFPLSDAVISIAPCQCASPEHDRLLQLIDIVRRSAVADSLLHGPK